MYETTERVSQTTPPPRRFDLAQEETVSALHKLFKGKCAYCEAQGHLNARPFRPAQEAEPLARSKFAHLYYAWLRTDWGNAYAVCSGCAMAAGNQFPTEKLDRGPLPSTDHLEAFANENYGLWRFGHQDRKKLLDPCGDRNFASHLSFSLSGEIQAFSKMGAQTIAVFDLDRPELVKSRAAAFESYVGVLLDELERGVSPNVFDFGSLEYGGGWSLLLRRILKAIERRADRDVRYHPDRVGATIAGIWNTQIGRDSFQAALEDVRRPVERPTVDRPVGKGETRRLVGVEVRNFKALQDVRLHLPPAVAADATTGRDAEASALLILGENAAGKSSILEAIAMALMDAKVRLGLVRSPRNFVLDPSLMGSEGQNPPPFATVTLNFGGGSELTLTIGDELVEGGVTDNLPPVFAYGAFRQYASRSPRKPPKGHVTTLFKSDALLANPEEWLLGLPDDEFAMVARALQRILMIEGEYEIVQRDGANRRCLIATKVGEGSDARYVRTPLRVVSSGFRSVLAMVCDVLAGLIALQPTYGRRSFGELEPVILIDEVEAHLHPRWKMQIMAALRRVFPKAVIMATTHDPLCLRGMHDQEVIVFNRALKSDEEGPDAFPVFVETISALPNVEDLTIEQLLTSDFFSMFSTDAPATELKLATLGDLIAKEAGPIPLTELERSVLRSLRDDVLAALPLGSSEVQRLVEEAVFEHVKRRRGLRSVQFEGLKNETRERILKALEAY
ncbi:AAA family ATPase [Bosea vestrisii]|uniref:AAA family ATPase n=1 Tax=Bosea vestrisii TaxID=151416 RepID=UPI0024E00CD2|nr:AAA family ATPase [Bosea vestrisii]WID94888.1 AAA family ATPase [Bosea vestrisii]